jgi:hypothetical protein
LVVCISFAHHQNLQHWRGRLKAAAHLVIWQRILNGRRPCPRLNSQTADYLRNSAASEKETRR